MGQGCVGPVEAQRSSMQRNKVCTADRRAANSRTTSCSAETRREAGSREHCSQGVEDQGQGSISGSRNVCSVE